MRSNTPAHQNKRESGLDEIPGKDIRINGDNDAKWTTTAG